MNDKHIIDLLESVPFASLGESELREIQAHSAACASCSSAYKAAVVSSAMLREGAGEVFEPSPFFQTRVMAAIREQQNEPRGLARFWRAAGALVSTLTATVALLAVVTFTIPATQSTAEATAFNGYFAEDVILDQTEVAQEQVSDAEVFSTLYTDEDEK